MKNRKGSDSLLVTLTTRPDVGASAPLPAKPEKANVNDNSRCKTSASAERQTYWTSDRYGWMLIVNGEMRARVEGPKVILLTHRDTKPRRAGLTIYVQRLEGAVSMRVLLIIGILLIAFGGYVLAGGFSYQAEKKSVDLGVLKASISETRVVPKWVGGLLIAGGLGLCFYGARRR